MPRGVYSSRIMDSSNPTYTVPEGMVCVVRDILMVFESDATVVLAAPGVGFLAYVDLPAGQSYHWSGRQVLNAGEQLELSGDGASVLVMAYLLTAP